MCDPKNIEIVKKLVLEKLPQCSVISESAGSLIFGVGNNEFVKLIPFFQIIQNNIQDESLKELSKHILSAGISHSSIDDVFLKVLILADY